MSNGFLKKTMYNCKQATLLALQKQQGHLSVAGRFKLSYHLLFCNACKQFVKQSALIDKAMQDYKQQDRPVSHSLSSSQKESLQQQIDALHP